MAEGPRRLVAVRESAGEEWDGETAIPSCLKPRELSTAEPGPWKRGRSGVDWSVERI